MNRLALMILKNIHRVPGAFYKLWRNAANPDKYPEQERWNHIQYIMKQAVKAGNIDLQVFGRENIPAEESYIMYGNHQGMFDVLAVVVSCDRPMGVVFKKEIENVPLIKQIAACTKSFGMDRSDVRQSLTVIQNVTKEVQSGRSYLIYPEGTRSRNGNEMLEFHGGSFRAALKAKCPIVPVAVIDSYKVLDEKGSKPVTVYLHYLDPIPYEEYKDLKTVDLAALVKPRIEETAKIYAG